MSPGGRLDLEVAVLIELRHRTLPSAELIAELTGSEVDAVEAQLHLGASLGHTEFRSGAQFAGWIVTRTGLEHLARLATDEGGSPGRSEALARLDAVMSQRHQDMIDIAVDWRVRTDDHGRERLNDHTDAAHDAEVVVRLEQLHRRVATELDALARCLARYGRYRARFDAALAAIGTGHHDQLTRPIPTSYLTVWFDLRSDIAITRGRDHDVPELSG